MLMALIGFLGLALGLVGAGVGAALAQAAPSISISPTSGLAGATVNINGIGFNANETGISVTYDGSPAVTGISADASGNWFRSYTIPASTATAHTFAATRTTPAGTVGPVSFTLLRPLLSLSRSSGASGTSLTVTGTGFGANERGITVLYDNAAVASGLSADAQGTWSATFTIPSSTAGAHTIGASSTTTPASAVAAATFTVTAGISISRTSGPSGTSLTVTGSGFSPNETGINVTYDGVNVSGASDLRADARGGWFVTFNVPPSPGGSHTIGAGGPSTTAASVGTLAFTVNPTITINRTSGPPGTSLTVTGTGFGANESGIKVTYDTNSVVSGIKADAQGAWTSDLTVPPSTGGAHAIGASGPTTQAASVSTVTFTIGAGISLSRASGPPGTSVTVSGAGFPGGERAITITYDGEPVASGINATAQGAFTATFTVPVSPGGAHTIGALGPTTLATRALEVSFIVGAGLSLSRSSGPPGTSVTVTGSGFGASERDIAVTYDGTQVASGISANPQGSWSATFTVPASAGGAHTIRASGASTAAASVSAVTFNTGPAISANRASGPPGTSVTVTGTGFGANERGISVTYDGAQVASGLTANAQGSWTATFSVPSSSAGPHAISASGLSAQPGAISEVAFNVGSGLALNRGTGPPGTSITVTGSGFGANERGISVTYDGVQVASGISANVQGVWTATLAVPPSPAGPHAISASGPSTQAGAASEVVFTVGPGLSLNRGSGPSGTSITVTGSGFGANERSITLTFDGLPVASGMVANAQGSWVATFPIPAAPGGSHIISAFGSAGQVGGTSETTFILVASLSVSRSSGPQGTSVTVTGSGFAANQRGITLTFDGSPVATGLTANAQGGWVATFPVPTAPGGTRSIKASSSAGQAVGDAEVPFVMEVSLSVNRRSGSPGSTITVTGAGFAANESGITVTYDGVAVVSRIAANAQGTWSTTFPVPPSPAGPHSIRVSGSVTQGAAIPDLAFSIVPTVTITPSAGDVGMKAAIDGAGFTPNSTVTLTFGDAEIKGSTTTDGAGSFNVSINIPRSRAGMQTLKVSDGQKNESQAAFAVESTPPRMPNPLSPKSGARIGLLGGATPTVSWSETFDRSGVTYILQIDTDPDFPRPFLEKPDIAATRYTLLKEEALPRGTYYWRVKAVDGAYNESPWSGPVLLKSGLLSVGALAAIILVGMLGVGSAAFFAYLYLSRRRRQLIRVGEVAMPVPAYFRELGAPEEPARAPSRALGRPPLLALPGPARRGRAVSPQDQARFKMLVEFARSLPLVQVGYDVDWLTELAKSAQSGGPGENSQEQLLQGGFSLRYEPAWQSHPLYIELRNALEGHPLLQGIDSFIEAVNQCATQSALFLQDIHRDTVAEVPAEMVRQGQWRFISGVYADALGWFRGKFLQEPSEREYLLTETPGPGDGAPGALWLQGMEGTAFAGNLIQAVDEAEALELRGLHLKLRRAYRKSEQARGLVETLAQVEVQRERLRSALEQLGTRGESR